MDISDSINTTLIDRMKTPLVGAFVVSWFFWNWEMLCVLFLNDDPIIPRIKVVKRVYISLEKLFFFPVLTSIIVTIFTPLIKALGRCLSAFGNILAIEFERIEMFIKEKHKLSIIRRDEDWGRQSKYGSINRGLLKKKRRD